MSVKVSSKVWQGSRHKSGNLLVLLALADHADDEGFAWPGIPLVARKARLSQRHTHRCLKQLVTSGEPEILPNRAPSGRTLYKIRLDQLQEENSSSRTSTSQALTPASVSTDTGDRIATAPYIEKPSIESSVEPFSKFSGGGSRTNSSSNRNKRKSRVCLSFSTDAKAGF
jgi:hypothetical protein